MLLQEPNPHVADSQSLGDAPLKLGLIFQYDYQLTANFYSTKFWQ